MEIRAQELTLPQHLAFPRLRLFDFNEQVCLREHLGCSAQEFSARTGIFTVRKSTSLACPTLNEDPMSLVDEGSSGSRCDTNTILVILYFLWNSYYCDVLRSSICLWVNYRTTDY